MIESVHKKPYRCRLRWCGTAPRVLGDGATRLRVEPTQRAEPRRLVADDGSVTCRGIAAAARAPRRRATAAAGSAGHRCLSRPRSHESHKLLEGAKLKSRISHEEGL